MSWVAFHSHGRTFSNDCEICRRAARRIKRGYDDTASARSEDEAMLRMDILPWNRFLARPDKHFIVLLQHGSRAIQERQKMRQMAHG